MVFDAWSRASVTTGTFGLPTMGNLSKSCRLVHFTKSSRVWSYYRSLERGSLEWLIAITDLGST